MLKFCRIVVIGNFHDSIIKCLTTTTRIHFAFLLLVKFCILSGVKITIALISTRQAKPEGFWDLQSNGTIIQMSYYLLFAVEE